jgi:hypothetical protein
MDICSKVLHEKGQAYSGSDEDRLKNFKVADVISSAPNKRPAGQKKVLWGYMLKHITSIYYMCGMGSRESGSLKKPSRADWDEKLVDTINYLLLLTAMVDEEIREERENKCLPRIDSTDKIAEQRKYKKALCPASLKAFHESRKVDVVDRVMEA